MLTFFADEAEWFACNFSLSGFPLRTESLLRDMHIIPSIVSAIISKVDPHKACELYGISDNNP